jgi:GntR family transcriptional regulator
VSTISEQVQGRNWERVADGVRDAIISKALEPGGKLKSEAALQAEFGVSRNTVRHALSELTSEGLITEGAGRLGRNVRDYHPIEWHLWLYESRGHHEQAGEPGDQFESAIRALGRTPKETVKRDFVDPAPARVSELLQIQPGEIVVVRRRVRSVDGIPYQLADSYFRHSLIKGTLLMEQRSVSCPGGVLASIGHPQARYRDEIILRMPTKPEREKLSLPKASPVGEITRAGYDEAGVPVRVMITIAPGARHKFVYEMGAS